MNERERVRDDEDGSVEIETGTKTGRTKREYSWTHNVTRTGLLGPIREVRF